MTDFPLIYCNGDSYSDENFHPSWHGNTYVNAVAKECGGFAMNKAISGSCNRRIIRTTVHDMIQQRQLNPQQQIIALIGLSFEMRSEIWNDKIMPTATEESQFVTHSFSSQLNWRQNLLAEKSIESQQQNKHQLDEKFFKKYSEGRAYFYSPYAERINLLCDLIMLRSLLESLQIDFLIFQSPPAEKLDSDHLLNFFKAQLESDPRIFDLESFSFCTWCAQQQFVPIDAPDRPDIAHYGPNAHWAFAEQVLIPRLKDLHIL